jgi:uncharacterized membrane protein
MAYDIHPLLVHFPIALLFLYSVLRLLPLSTLFPQVSWQQIERALLFFGILGAGAALATGETAEHISRPQHSIVEMHSFFATLSTFLYGALLLGECSSILNTRVFIDRHWLVIAKISRICEKFLCNRVFVVVVSVVALVCISITGLLGGVMVYGVTADPVANVILKLLGLTITQ